MQYAGRVSDINLVNGPTHHEFFVADLLQLIKNLTFRAKVILREMAIRDEMNTTDTGTKIRRKATL